MSCIASRNKPYGDYREIQRYGHKMCLKARPSWKCFLRCVWTGIPISWGRHLVSIFSSQYYTEAQRLTERVLALENRLRIWKALGSIGTIFQNLEKEENPTRLSVLISETYPIFTRTVDPGLKYWNKHMITDKAAYAAGCSKRFPHTIFVRGDPPANEPCECEKPLNFHWL